MMIKLTDTCLYEGMVREGDMVFLENCRMNGKREMIMPQMADLMGSICDPFSYPYRDNRI